MAIGRHGVVSSDEGDGSLLQAAAAFTRATYSLMNSDSDRGSVDDPHESGLPWSMP